MKFTTGILGCALAAGLMAFATDKAQAVVIGNDLYIPLDIKLSVSYWDANGNIKQARVTSKDVLKQVGAPKDTLLAVDFNSPYDVFLVNGTTLGPDLTTAGYLTMISSDTLDNYTAGKNGSWKYSETGILEIDVYSDPVFSEGLDKAASEENSSEWFEISGFYSYNETGSAIDNNSNQKFSANYKAKALSGYGHDSVMDLDIPSTTVLTGSATASASGKLAILPSIE
jgi:hypothetical protein